MTVSITNMVILLGIMLVASVAFLAVASPQSERTVGRRLYGSTWVVWSIMALIIQFVIVKWAFHPLSYIIFTGVVCLMEWLTIRVPKDRPLDEIESPASRFFAWLLFSLGPTASMVIAAKIATPEGAWAFKGKTILLYCLVLLGVIGVGIIRIAICGICDIADEDDDEEYEDLETVDVVDGAESVA